MRRGLRLRLAFYGRISTAEYQDDVLSRQWQRDNAARLSSVTGGIVAWVLRRGARLARAHWPTG
jgi:hypothetical protein